MLNVSISLVIFAALFVGSIILQIYLSKMKSKWPGLILPLIFLIISVIFPLVFMHYTEDFLFQFIIAFLLFNIPTLIYLGIYFSCREKYRRNKQIDKMNIQDLD